MTRGAIILCGGQSTRMGRDKNWLPFGPDETMLQRVVRLASEAVPAERIICVAAPGQSLPELPTGVQIAHDTEPKQGPLAGLATGLTQSSRHTQRAVTDTSSAVFVLACDTPLLDPTVIARMFDLLGEHQIAAPHDGERWHPLPAVYRTSALPQIESLLAAGKRSLVALLESTDCRHVLMNELQDIDPQLNSLISCNSPEDYEAAKIRAGV